MPINLNISAPLHLNGELVATQIKRNALDQENKTNFTTLNNALNYNSSVVGSGLQNDNLGTACVKPRNLSKQMGSKDFYYNDPGQGINYISNAYFTWYVIGFSGGTGLAFDSATKVFSAFLNLAIVVNDSNSTIELDVNFETYAPVSVQQKLVQTVDLYNSLSLTTIIQSKNIKKWFVNNGEITGNGKIIFSGLPAGTYYIVPKLSIESPSYFANLWYCTRTQINYEVSNATFN